MKHILLFALAFGAISLAAERKIALIIDTSGSMRQNDHSRYAPQIAKILTDLTADGDHLAVVRMPQAHGDDVVRSLLRHGAAEDCSAPANPALVVTMEGSDRRTFKNRVDALIHSDGPTFFAAPIHTALPFLGMDTSTQRLLLFIADAGGFGDCNAALSEELQKLRSSGATLALINIGPIDPSGGFSNNPAFQFVNEVDDSAKLIGAVAQVYQQFLGSSHVQTGPVNGEIKVKISDHVKEAYLVVAAESPLGKLEAAPGNPPAGNVDLDYRGGGQTVGVDNRTRGYRIVRLTNPPGNSFTFIPPPGTTGGWMLLEDYALALRMITQTPVPENASSTIQLEVIDERDDKRVTDAPTLTSLRIDGKIDSSIITLTNTGSGIFTAEHQFGTQGPVPLQLRLRGSSIDRSYRFSVDVTKDAPKQEAPPPPPTPPSLAGPNDLDFGRAEPINFGQLTSGSDAQGELRLEDARVARDLDIEISTDFEKRHAGLEIQTPEGWKKLSALPVRMRLAANDPMHWPIRLRAGSCPEVCQPGEAHKVSFSARRSHGGQQGLDVPVQVEIAPDPWYICWRLEILAGFGLVALAIVAHGFLSPYRFGSRIGVQMSSVEDLGDGFFFPFRASRGSGAGFYKDASVFLTEDFRVTPGKQGGFVRLRAFKNSVRIKPENGRSVWRQQVDGNWEQLNAHQEVVARPGVAYRNDQRTVYFDIRTK